ncbi:recombinase family protein [Methylobacterium mesophilicum]
MKSSAKRRQEPVPKPATLRCAIYARVSTEHGLEQEFNSLDNQREAAEAYVKSQAHEGWRCLPDRFDDGGFSGGSLDRPALRRLLVEIQARRIDVVVVYKVDRLTRALSDFAKLVETFDGYGVSFVSVTQAFNTTTSMGRLTLNVLLSFAQFEREVTGERIRDKIAASKRKGLWMGGVVPLGYRAADRALHVVPDQAEVVRMVFARYLALSTVGAVKDELEQAGICVPERLDGKGRKVGGGPFSRGQLYQILTGPIYVGRLTHRGRVYEGQHAGIVDPAIFDAVQAQLARNHHGHTARRQACAHLLAGRIRDDHGHLMTPSHTAKGSRRYRYYVSQAVLKGKPAGQTRRISAHDIEALVLAALRAAPDSTNALPPASTSTPASDEPLTDSELIAARLGQVTVHPGTLHIDLVDAEDRDPIQVAWAPKRVHNRRDIIVTPGSKRPGLRPMKPEDRARILKAIARSRAWIDDLAAARVTGTDAIAAREGCSERSVRMVLPLAQLSPRVVVAIVEGRLPRGIGVRDLVVLPVSWADQEHTLGL